MHADVLPEDVGVFVVLNSLDARVAIQCGDRGAVQPAEDDVAGRGSVGRIVVGDLAGWVGRQARVGIVRTGRIVRCVGISVVAGSLSGGIQELSRGQVGRALRHRFTMIRDCFLAGVRAPEGTDSAFLMANGLANDHPMPAALHGKCGFRQISTGVEMEQ